MATFGTIIAFMGLIMFWIGLFRVFKPKKGFGRKKAILIFVIGLAVMVAGATLMPGGEEQPVKKEESKERLVESEKTRNKKLVDSIIEFDEATWHWIIQSDKAMEHLSKVMDLGKYSAYQIYQVAEEVKEYQYSASTAFTSRSAPNKEWGELANEYLHIFSMREFIARDLMKYLDNPSNKSLLEIQGRIERTNKDLENAIITRIQLLEEIGYELDKNNKPVPKKTDDDKTK